MKKINNIVVSTEEIPSTNDIWLKPTESGSAEMKYFGNQGWSDISAGAKNIVWTETSKLSDYLEPGIYVCQNSKRYTLDDELPILNVWSEEKQAAYISFTLIVNKAVSFENPPNKYERIGQTLILTNRAGNETKQYIRTVKHTFNQVGNSWTTDAGAWQEYKSVTNLDQRASADLDNYVDNGIYEGVILNAEDLVDGATSVIAKIEAFIIQTNDVANSNKCWRLPSGSLFTMEVKNNYAIAEYATSLGIPVDRKVTQTAKLQLLNGLYAEVSRFTTGDTTQWTPWYNMALYGTVAQSLRQ